VIAKNTPYRIGMISAEKRVRTNALSDKMVFILMGV